MKSMKSKPAFLRALLPALLLASLLTLPGCLIYRIDVQQGNEITVQMLDRLQLGMSRREVGKTLGFPLLSDPFHINRWDYYFYRRRGNSGAIEQHFATLRFADDALVRVESSLFEN
ncbi:MAG: outer membrane protein assembly factor BamE [Gammaproteobacteria bacterium]